MWPLFQVTFDLGNSPTIPAVFYGEYPFGVFVGMKCSLTGHTLPHRLLLLLKPRNLTSREVFPPLQYPRGIITSTHNLGGLSTPREDYHLASHYPGGLSPPREDYHLSISWGIITPWEDYHLSPCRFWTVTPICREKWPAVHIWSSSSLTPFLHNNSGLVICFYLRGYGLRALITHLIFSHHVNIGFYPFLYSRCI